MILSRHSPASRRLLIFKGGLKHAVSKLARGVDCIAPTTVRRQEQRWALSFFLCLKEAEAKRKGP